MFHSVTICGKNSWTDYHMVPVDGIYLPPPPELKVTTIDLKAADGKIDISTLLTGYPVFNNRTGSLTYYILNPYDYSEYAEVGGTYSLDDFPSAYDIFSQVMADIHGQYGKMYFEDDPDWEYEGRFTVSEYATTEIRRSITINYDVKPYKIKRGEPTSISLTSLSADVWAYNDLEPDILGYMPNNPAVTITGLQDGDVGTVRILYPSSGQNPYSDPARTIDISTGVNVTDKTWANFLFYKRARLAYKGPAGSSATFKFNQGRF